MKDELNKHERRSDNANIRMIIIALAIGSISIVSAHYFVIG